MIFQLEEKKSDAIAMIDDRERSISYSELKKFVDKFYDYINHRTLIFILADSSIGSAAGYIASIENKIVPLLLNPDMDTALLQTFLEKYSPEYILVPDNKADCYGYKKIASFYGSSLLKTGMKTAGFNDELSLLLTTSGSTGSPKLVRHSYKNILANAVNVSEAFQISVSDRALASLPLYFTQGLSVLSSYIYAGATVLLTNYSLTQKEYWNFFKEQKVSIFTGVPYSFEILKKIRFFRMELPDLQVLSQGGGRLNNELFQEVAQYAKVTNKKFIATYGSTETTSRMAFLSANRSADKCGSIGKAISNGKIELVDEEGQIIIAPDIVGELVYYGDNVTMGYAECFEDLQLGDMRHGVYHTGDLAKYDSENFLYIVGRKKRFLKLYGYRVGLDETERLIKDAFSCECACVGTDKKMIIYITDKNLEKKVLQYVYEKTKIHFSAFEVRIISDIPKTMTGKILYSGLEAE